MRARSTRCPGRPRWREPCSASFRGLVSGGRPLWHSGGSRHRQLLPPVILYGVHRSLGRGRGEELARTRLGLGYSPV